MLMFYMQLSFKCFFVDGLQPETMHIRHAFAIGEELAQQTRNLLISNLNCHEAPEELFAFYSLFKVISLRCN